MLDIKRRALLEGKAVVLVIENRLDHTNTAAFETVLRTEGENGVYQIIVDLTHLHIVFSIAIGVLWANCQKLRSKGGDVVLLGVQPAVQEILETLGIASELKIFTEESSAVEYLKSL